MRFCPDGFEEGYEDSVIGLTIFHELMHMNSIVGDHGGYDRSEMVALARRDPTKARLNSSSYMSYIA